MNFLKLINHALDLQLKIWSGVWGKKEGRGDGGGEVVEKKVKNQQSHNWEIFVL